MEDYWQREMAVAKPVRGTRTMAVGLGRGSQLASRVYRSLPKNQQGYALFCILKTAAIQALKEGRGEEEVLVLLEALAGTKDKVQSPMEGAAERKNNTIIKPLPHTGSQLFVDASGRLRHGACPLQKIAAVRSCS